jgi:hypothetical protein
MHVLGKLALGVVAGGLGLGTILGAAANPVMKQPPEQPWRDALLAPVVAEADYVIIEAGPEDLSPYPDRYAPTWAREELAYAEPDYPAWSYSEPVDAGDGALSVTKDSQADGQPVLSAPEPVAAPEPAPQPVAVEPLAQDQSAATEVAALY